MSVSDQNALDRREWMKVSAAGVAATAVAGSASAQDKADEVQKVSDPVPTRPLGRSGIPVSMLNLGTCVCRRRIATIIAHLEMQSQSHARRWL